MSIPTEEEFRAAAAKLNADPFFQAFQTKAQEEIDTTGHIKADTIAALLGAEVVTNPADLTPRSRAILGAANAFLPSPNAKT